MPIELLPALEPSPAAERGPPAHVLQSGEPQLHHLPAFALLWSFEGAARTKTESGKQENIGCSSRIYLY